MSHVSRKREGAQAREQVKSEERNNADYDACDEADNSNEQNVKWNPEDHDMYSDQDYEELGRRAQRKIRKKKRIAQEKKHSEEDSDEEYDRLARKVWKNSDVEKTRTRAKKQNTSDTNSDNLLNSDAEYSKLVSEGLNKECKSDIIESNGRETPDNDTEDKCEEEVYDEEEGTNTCNGKKNEGFECVEISDSDESRKLDPDYLCSEESDSDTCTQSDTSISSSSLSKECEGLLTELIEVIGEEKVSEGSFLDLEQDWRNTVKEFKDSRLAQGHAFKSTLESAEELAQVNEDSMHKAFHAVLDGDESDDDEALDTNWVPSDCEVNENEKIKTKGQAESDDLGTETLLTEF